MKKILSKLKQIKLPEKFKIILTLFSFAVTQPLFDVLNKNQEFFVAGRWSSFDIIIFLILLSIIIPIFIYNLVFFIEKLNKKFGNISFNILNLIFFTLIFMGWFSKAGSFIQEYYLFISLILALILSILIDKRDLKKIVSFLWISVILFMCLFLFANRLVIGTIKSLFDQKHEEIIKIKNPVPIVFLVFDELPLTSLLSDINEIDHELFPNFYSLSNQSDWYVNASSVAETTAKAIPAMLTGNFPKSGKLPTHLEYPNNMFLLLNSVGYELNVFENVTQLCPKIYCTNEEGKNENSLLPKLNDLLIIYLTSILSVDNINNYFPNINNSWNNFNIANNDNLFNSNKEFLLNVEELQMHGLSDIHKKLLKSIEKSDKNKSLFYFHHQLPHWPYIYSPSGNQFSDWSSSDFRPFDNKGVWKNQVLLEQSYQRLLLQLSFVDNILGQIVSELKSANIFDKSIIVVTSDHGVILQPEVGRRSHSDIYFYEHISVPLFIKKSYQEKGEKHYNNVESIDILPTILDYLETSNTEFLNFDGYAISENPKDENKDNIKSVIHKDDKLTYSFNNFVEGLSKSIKYKINTFKWGVYGRNSSAGWIIDLIVDDDRNIEVAYDISYELKNKSFLENFVLDSGFVPIFLSGTLNRCNIDLPLVVSLNNVITGIVDINYSEIDNKCNWSAIVNERYLKEGNNEISLYLVEGSQINYILKKVNEIKNIVYKIDLCDERECIKNDLDQEMFIIEKETKIYDGRINSFRFFEDKKQCVIKGWAVNLVNREPVDQIMIFNNNELVVQSSFFYPREDVGEWLGDEFTNSGFRHYFLSDPLFLDSIRIFGIYNNSAYELSYKIEFL